MPRDYSSNKLRRSYWNLSENKLHFSIKVIIFFQDIWLTDSLIGRQTDNIFWAFLRLFISQFFDSKFHFLDNKVNETNHNN